MEMLPELPTNNSFSFKAFQPLLDWGRVVGMEAGRVGQHLFPIHQGLIPFYEHDPPIRNQGLISQLTASSSIISIQTN